jgi:menaquinone-dependent protoporphyrinogen IX oxidase
MEGMVVYKGKYGATKQYAEWAGAALNVPVNTTEETNVARLEECGWLVIGTSIYVGEFQVKKWLLQHLQILAGKKLIFFVVCGTPLNRTDDLENYLRRNVPAELLAGARVFFLPGKMKVSSLRWSDRMVLKMGAMFAGKEGGRMLTDYNDVQEKHIAPVIAAARSILQPA